MSERETQAWVDRTCQAMEEAGQAMHRCAIIRDVLIGIVIVSLVSHVVRFLVGI